MPEFVDVIECLEVLRTCSWTIDNFFSVFVVLSLNMSDGALCLSDILMFFQHSSILHLAILLTDMSCGSVSCIIWETAREADPMVSIFRMRDPGSHLVSGVMRRCPKKEKC